MNYSTIILGVVLVFFGILFILLLVYVVQTNKAQKSAQGGSTNMPPLDYMRNIGVRCPDYWVYMGKDPSREGYHICKNVFNIPVNNPGNSVCYSDEAGKTKSFKDANMGSDGKMDKTAERERCEFVAQCGPSADMKASWLGVSSEQMSPGWVNCGTI